jgi:hypothetical protein
MAREGSTRAVDFDGGVAGTRGGLAPPFPRATEVRRWLANDAMRITKFWARGYRSLKDVTLAPIGPFAVFYGPNGSGKSNVLAAIDALHRCVGLVARDPHASLLNTNRAGQPDARSHEVQAAEAALREPILTLDDRALPEMAPEIVFGATWTPHDGEFKRLGWEGHAITVEITADLYVTGAPRLYVSRLECDGVAPPRLFDVLPRGMDTARELLGVVAGDFAMIDVVRAGGDGVKRALFDASVSPHRKTRDRFARLRQFLQDPPLCRPPFEVVRDPATDSPDVRERFGDAEVSIDRIGLGHMQVYAILTTILLQRGDMVAVEEPEAHLHAPTTGRGMRDCLLRVVKNRIIDQLFVATHSNLFDLDPDGYWDVRINEETKSTLIARKPLQDLEQDHLYEPGPMKRVLRVMLEQYRDDARVMFLARDGKKVTAAELIHHLDDDDDLALEYVRGLYSAAMELYGRQARRAAP